MIRAIVIFTIIAMVSIVNMIQISPENNQCFLLWGYLMVSLVSFGMYAYDKSAAKNNRWRVPENSLHVLALFGGWPGAMLGQRILRHKTVKQPFRFIFWLTVLVNCAAVFWFLFPGLVPSII
ncbi:MAG: DUF1294 domain-containing protein [Methylophagaceae bacterium]